MFYASSKPEIVTVSSEGVVTAVKPGSCKITVYTANLKKTTINVTVKGLVTSVKILNANGNAIKKGKTVKLPKGGTLQLGALLNDDALDKTVSWSSGKPKIASVDPATGLVTALKTGQTKITLKALDGSGKKTNITIKVTKAKPADPADPTNPSEPSESPDAALPLAD